MKRYRDCVGSILERLTQMHKNVIPKKTKESIKKLKILVEGDIIFQLS